MPFPLNSLDYNSLCRLRELVTPSEAYDLQLAAPHIHTLKPIQTVQLILDAYISVNSDNELSVQGGDHLMVAANEVAKDDFYMITNKLKISDTVSSTKTVLKITSHFRFNGRNIVFENCRVSSELLKEICCKSQQKCYLDFINCTFDISITPQSIFTPFKNLQRLTFTHGCPFKHDWINCLLDAGVTDMIGISLNDAKADVLSNINSLVKFLKRQQAYFTLLIVLADEVDGKKAMLPLDNFDRHAGGSGPLRFLKVRWRGAERTYSVGDNGHSYARRASLCDCFFNIRRF